MSLPRDHQHSVIFSITEFPKTRAEQFSNIISITELPSCRAHMLAMIYSVSPAIPKHYSSQKAGANAKGGMSLIIDMEANSKR